jgi:hypothetical protein
VGFQLGEEDVTVPIENLKAAKEQFDASASPTEKELLSKAVEGVEGLLRTLLDRSGSIRATSIHLLSDTISLIRESLAMGGHTPPPPSGRTKCSNCDGTGWLPVKK